jgi:nucleoside phosphorylase/CheY-like chemotaxis protein
VARVLLTNFSDSEFDLFQVETYEEALNALRERYYDVVIIDLLLPALDGTISKVSSRAIINAVLRGTNLISPMHIIGLTAYENIAEEERNFYEENLLAIEFYDPTDQKWEKRLIAKIRYLFQSKKAGLLFQAQSYDLDVFVLAARHENEFLPVRKRLFTTILGDHHPLWPSGVCLGQIRLKDGRVLNAGLACIGEMGMATAAAVTSQAISVFRPRLVAMLGMCCGFTIGPSPRKLLDAIVIREVDCWEEGKYVALSGSHNEFQNRSKSRLVDDAIRQDVESIIERSVETIQPALRRLARQKMYKDVRALLGDQNVRERPDVKFAPIVSGSSVIADRNMVAEILDRHPSAIGLDMEIFGVYAAADRSLGRRPSVLGIKGVADFGEATKNDAAQAAASLVATEVFKSILPHLRIFGPPA